MNKTLFCIVLLLMAQCGVAQNPFEKAFKDKTRPSRENIRISLMDAKGNQTFLPISIIKGKKEGPVFTMMAGVHGFEYPPIVAIQELMKEISMDSLAGTLIIIPIANTASFYSRTPFINPQDKVNLNNAFPGKVDGSVTQKIADFITTYIIPVSNVFLDIHGGDASEDLLPYICYYNNKEYPDQTRKAKELSEISGFTHIVSYPYTIKETDPAKYAFKQACQDGKVAFSIECGKLGNVQEEAVNLIINGVYNMLSNMDMYPKSKKQSHPKQIRLNAQNYIDADVSGIFYSSYKAGDTVKKGNIIGYITDEFGVKISEFKAPVSGVILYKVSTPPVNKEDTLMCISYAK